MNESKNRSKSQALAIYLFWLKTGIDDLDKDNRELVIPKKHEVTSCLYYLE